MELFLMVNGLNGESVESVSRQIHEIEKKAWNSEMGASLKTISHRLQVFPEGLWRLYHGQILVSYMYFIRIDETQKYYSWFDYCAGGSCDNYKKDGKLLFGVSIGSIEKHMGNNLFSLGMDKIIDGYYKGVENVCMCSRLPSLSNLCKNIEDTSIIRIDNPDLLSDHVVKMFMKKGCNPIALCENGYDIDEESLGYSMTMGRQVNENNYL